MQAVSRDKERKRKRRRDPRSLTKEQPRPPRRRRWRKRRRRRQNRAARSRKARRLGEVSSRHDRPTDRPVVCSPFSDIRYPSCILEYYRCLPAPGRRERATDKDVFHTSDEACTPLSRASPKRNSILFVMVSCSDQKRNGAPRAPTYWRAIYDLESVIYV